MPSVLIVDDEPNIRRMVGALLTSEGYEVREAADATLALQHLTQAEPDVALVDLMMPGAMDGLGLLERMRADVPEMPVVMMSGRAALADAVRATRLGAFTFLEKPLAPESVLLALGSALELRTARRTARTLREDLGLEQSMIGESVAMRDIRSLIERVGPSEGRVLITGESGTGKELVASALHLASPRRDRPFVRVNCAAIPRDLVESEMFGHEKGAFTGATDRRIGRFELAHTGTLFLDEIADLGLEAQAKLLRAIEAHEIERLGGGRAIRVDVRILAATNKDLARAVQEGAFREDLFFRLNVVPIAIPPLRERREDIPALVLHFTERLRARTGRAPLDWPAETMLVLGSHAWPGNVRELANLVERLSILHAGETVAPRLVRRLLGDASDAATPPAGAASLSVDASSLPGAPSDPYALPLAETLDAYERALLTKALRDATGNVAEAARRLRTDRPNLYRRLRRLGLLDG